MKKYNLIVIIFFCINYFNAQESVSAETLEIGMSKQFYLVDGNIINGKIIDIVDNKCHIQTPDGLLKVPMTDILEEIVDLIKDDETKYKGPLISEDRTTIVIRSNYGDVTIDKKEVQKMDRYHGGKLIPWIENKKDFYEGEAQLVGVFLDPTAFPLSGNTFYVSGLSLGYGFTDRFMLTTQFGSNFSGDLNLNPKMRFIHEKTEDKEISMSWGLGLHRAYPIKSIVSKYSHAFDYIASNDTIRLNEKEDFTKENLNYFIDDNNKKVTLEAYLVYTSRRDNPTGRGKVGWTVGCKTSNLFFLIDDTYMHNSEDDILKFDKDNWHFKIPFRIWGSFEYDLQKKLKFVGSVWADNSNRSMELPVVIEDYIGDDGSAAFSLDTMSGQYNMFDFDFGFLYAVNENFRIGVHFQQPYIDIYWEFFEL